MVILMVVGTIVVRVVTIVMAIKNSISVPDLDLLPLINGHFRNLN